MSLVHLFRYADRLDLILLVFGILGAIVTGAAQPFMTVLFGNLINAFGRNTNDARHMIHTVTKVCTLFHFQSYFLLIRLSIVILMSFDNALNPCCTVPALIRQRNKEKEIQTKF